MSRAPTGPRRRRTQRDRTVGRRRVLLVRAQDDGDAGRRLLERLEQGRLGILVHPVGALDDRHPGAALDRHQRQLDDQVAGRPRTFALAGRR